MSEEKIDAFTKKHMDMILDKEEGLYRYFTKIRDLLKEYMDMEEEYYSLVALWIIGTYFHKQFSSYPYLFFNAMKGSGKTRVLKIIATLSKKGKVVGSMTEAVLFRTAKERTFCIDELEGTNEKGKENLKLLLNSAYKKGLSVERMVKRKDEQVVEEFEVYCPITMANVWGLDNVLQDRCISVVLEKSSKTEITKLIENFEGDIRFQTARGGILKLTESLKDNQGLFSDVFNRWNAYQKNIVKKVSIVSVVEDVSMVNNKEDIDTIDNVDAFRDLFQSINKTNLSGRDLELFFPLFILAEIIGKDVLEEIINTSHKVVRLRKESDREESKDVKLYEFIAQSSYEGFIFVSDIAKDLSEYSGEDPKYNTPNSVSRALNRLKLILDKRSTGKKRQVKINISKAQEKLLLFKDPSEVNFSFLDKEPK